jgi:hypothetical protein
VRRKTGEPVNGGAGRGGKQGTGSLTAGHGKLKDYWGLWKLSEKELQVFQGIKRSWTEGDEEVEKVIGQ